MRVALLYTPAGGGHRAAANALAAELADAGDVHVDRTAPPLGGAAGRGQAATVDRTAPPLGGAAGRGQAASVDRTAPPLGGAAGLGQAASVDVRDVLEFAPRWFAYDRVWTLIQHHGAHAWDWLFDTTDRGGLHELDVLRRSLHRALFAELDRYLVATRPTHIACTHYLPALAAARVAPRIGARTLVTITDHAPHRAWIVPGIDAYAVADAAVARAVARRTAGAAEVWETGIPIARAAGAPVRAVAAELARPRVLALLGGVPRRDALAAVDALAPLAASHALHVLTGDDADVRAHAARVLPAAELAPRANGLLAAIDAADVVVSKAGGLTVSECLARGRALVLPFAAPGQERGNRDYACAAGAAVRPLEVADLGAVIAALGAEPGALRRMGARARLASHPHAAADAARALRGASASRGASTSASRDASAMQAVKRVA